MKIVSTLALSLITSTLALAETTPEEQINSLFPKMGIVKILPSELDGLYEVYINNGEMIYVAPTKQIVFNGELFTTSGKRLATPKKEAWKNEMAAKRLADIDVQEVNKIALPLQKHKSTYEFVVITDPDCPYCKKMESYLFDKKIPLSVIFLPLDKLHPEAESKVLSILSSEKPSEAYKNHLEQSISIVQKPSESAKNTLISHRQFAKKIGVSGTPAVLVIDTKTKKTVDIVQGYDIKKIENWIQLSVSK